MSVERIEVSGSGELLEGPHWDPHTKCLYYVDIYSKNLFKYSPEEETCVSTHIDEGWPSVIIPVEGQPNRFLITVNTQLAVVDWDGIACKVSPQIIAEVENSPPGHRINDAKCDPLGRLWFGSMGPEPARLHIREECGTLYNLMHDGSVKAHFDGIGIPNGLAWNADNTLFYYIDSYKYTIDQFDYDQETATISNRTPIFSLKKHNIEGIPDGMTIDTDGNLWVAIFNGSCVIKIDPRQPETLLLKIQIPAKQVTSVAWGGPNLDELYVTSANIVIDGVINPGIHHGGLFRVTELGARGFPASNSKL